MSIFTKGSEEEPQCKNENVQETGRLKRVLKECFHMVVIPVALALFCGKVLIVNANIPSGSMENTIHPGDRVIGSRLAYLSQDPQRSDIIIFKFPDDESQVFIKRIIGLPGEEIQIVAGAVYIDGAQVPLKEEYLKEIPQGSFGPYVVPEDSYFVMGDNRNNSHDSRFWKNHFVARDEILAKAWFQYFPKIGLVD
ncbi:signal peptidase I [Sporofaciens sp. JLR.KK001]|jgi:signal peptidase I|uniref:signal peptidase I n=1 Tax=Sporofaciens sp. JLR.KK001 TaxID=3112621 RepID=UPI002FEFCB22